MGRSDSLHDKLRPSTKEDRRDYSFMMGQTLMWIHALTGEWPTDEEIRSWSDGGSQASSVFPDASNDDNGHRAD